jgi:hypothetical protein
VVATGLASVAPCAPAGSAATIENDTMRPAAGAPPTSSANDTDSCWFGPSETMSASGRRCSAAVPPAPLEPRPAQPAARTSRAADADVDNLWILLRWIARLGGAKLVAR